MDFKITSRIAVFWICCASFTHLFAQKEIISRQYTMEDGLPEEWINAAIQDSHGFIWIASASGLSKFDGYRFTNYKNNPGSSNSLGHNLVYSLLEDKKRRLWIAHAQGLDLLDPQTEKYFHWPYFGDSTNERHNLRVESLRERNDGKIWICTSQGVYVGDPETLKIDRFTQLPFYTHDIGETKDGSVVSAISTFISSTKKWTFGVCYIDAKTGVITQFMHDPDKPESSSFPHIVLGLKVDKRNRVWVVTDRSLALYNPREKSFTHYPTKGWVLDILENRDGTFWLGGIDGVYAFDPESGKIAKLTNVPAVHSVMKDRQGIVWISSKQGFWQIHSKSKQFSIYHQFGQAIGDIAQDINQDIWILGCPPNAATSLFKFSLSKNTTYNYGEQPPSSAPTSPSEYLGTGSLFRDIKGNIWLASSRKVEKYNAENRKFYNTSTIPRFWRLNGFFINAGFIDSHGNIWIGNEWGVLFKFDPITGNIEEFLVPGYEVHSFLEDSYENIWIGSSGGLTRYALRTGKQSSFIGDSDDPKSLSNNTVYHLMMDNEKNIWVGTGGGLNKMIKGTENSVPKFLNWRTAQSGLPNDDVYCIVQGGDGTLWMTCGNMISHFYPQQNIFRSYDDRNGLSGRSFRDGRGLRIHDGTIFFGGADGVVFFHPDSLQQNSFIPPITITSFSIRDQIVPVEATDADTLKWETPLKQHISYTDEIRLTYDQNDFTLEFAALNFVNPERNQYKYKLEPYEREWTQTNGANRFARYTNISPGEYTFRAIGSNNDGVWNEEGTTLVIIIAPPWWQTWWAYSIYVLTFIGMFIYWRKYENKRITLKNRAEYLSELDNLKSRFFTNISHEFRTPITLILGPLKDMYNGTFKGDQKPVLAVMMRNGQRLLRLINQLLDLSKLEVGKMVLHATPVDLVQFVREITSSYESLAADKKIRYFFYTEAQELIAYIDQEKIEKVLHNLLSNAFKFTREGGEVILNLKIKEKRWAVISVKDTGIGIPADQLDKIFDRFYQVDGSQTRGYEGSGLGMAVAKELVTLHHGRIILESTEGKGTAFTVLLPLGEEHLRNDQIIEAENTKKSKLFFEGLMPAENLLIMENVIEETPVSSDHQHIVLIVEDNTDMRNYIRKILSSHYQTIEAENGKEAVKKALEIIPDLIISDLMMPEMDGYMLCEKIKAKELTSHIPIILLTAKADHESKLAGLETRADDYLSKPFDAEELKLIVRNHIEARNKMKERFSRAITLEPREISITSFDEKFLQKVLSIIEAHMDDENFSIEELGREVGYSNMHLYRKIKALAGQTPSQFLRTIRLKRAAALLSKESDNVTQIAYSVGFSSLSYFNKCFKEQFGVTPGKFSEPHQEQS